MNGQYFLKFRRENILLVDQKYQNVTGGDDVKMVTVGGAGVISVILSMENITHIMFVKIVRTFFYSSLRHPQLGYTGTHRGRFVKLIFFLLVGRRFESFK